jgi:hypothetical protein
MPAAGSWASPEGYAISARAHSRLWIAVSILLPFLSVACASVAWSEGSKRELCEFPLYAARPGAQADPTEISVGLLVLDLSEINDRSQTFSADFNVRLAWDDPRLAHAGRSDICIRPLEEVWNPKLRLLNQREVRGLFDDVVHIDPSGRVSYEQRYIGTLTTIADISRFPFDTRDLSISMVAVGIEESEIRLVVNPGHAGRLDVLSVPNWSIDEGTPRVSQFAAPDGRRYAMFALEFNAVRRSSYYVWSAMVPLTIIVFMSWTVFWINPAHLGAQLGLSATSMLTLIAYRFTLANLLPPVSYLTRMDFFVTGASILVFLALVEAVATGSLADRGSGELGRKIDTPARVVFPLAFLALMGVAFFADRS